MGSYYSPAELQGKAREIIEAAKEAAWIEVLMLHEAKYSADGEMAQEYFATGRIEEPQDRPRLGQIVDGRAEFLAWIEGHLAWIPGAFEPFTEPQPEDLDPLIEHAAAVEELFGASEGAVGAHETSWITKAQTDMADWEGVLSNNFQNNVLIPLPKIAENHGKIAENLASAMAATKNLYSGQKRDISELADQTIAALKGINRRGGDGAALGFTIAGALAVTIGALLVLPTAGGSLAGALALVEAGAAIGAATIGSGGPPLPLGGKSVPEVLDNMVNRMNDISNKRQELENKVVKALEKNHELLVTMRQYSNSTGKTGPVIPLRPRLIDDRDPTSGLFPEP